MKTLASIQYLRAVAALAVVAYHACQWSSFPVAVGAAGVDVFFIVSGFVMWITTANRVVPPLRFLARRAGRVVPLYWVVTLALAAAAAVAPGVFPNVTPQAGHIARSLLFIPHQNPQGDIFPLLAVGWTLNYEALFYLVFAAVLLLKPDQRLGALAAVLAGISVFGLIYFPAYTYMANPMFLQFLAGAGLGRLYLQRALPGRWGGTSLVLAGVAGFAACEVFGVVPDSLMRPVLWGLPALVLATGAVAIERDGALPAWPWLRRLGDASYALYLVHTPVIALLNKATGPLPPPLFFTLAVLASVAAGVLLHHAVERPLLGWVRGKSAPTAQVAGADPPIAERSGSGW